jgi:hypothetical protein
MGVKLSTVLLLATLTSACGSVPKMHLHFSGGPDDALVHINDRYVGKLGRLEKQGIKLRPGDYRVTVDAVGYFPDDQLVTIVAEQQPTPLKIELEEVPD